MMVRISFIQEETEELAETREETLDDQFDEHSIADHLEKDHSAVGESSICSYIILYCSISFSSQENQMVSLVHFSS